MDAARSSGRLPFSVVSRSECLTFGRSPQIMEVILTPVAGVDVEQLPGEKDFDPWGGCLDAQSAWKNFGGLTLADAYAKFCDRPEIYQEDFMFMGCGAFHYYFPALEAYLRGITSSGDGDDCEAPIIGAAIEAQFDWRGAIISAPLRDRIAALCSFVLSHVERFASSEADRRRIIESWSKLKHRLEAKESEANKRLDRTRLDAARKSGSPPQA